MKISQFIICTPPSDVCADYLLYNTYNTTLITLEPAKYEQVFLNHDFSDKELVNSLYEWNFLIDEEIDEFQAMEEIRKTWSSPNKTNITILTTTDCNARCYYCFEKGIHHYDMTKETADATIEYIKSSIPDKELGIGWFGGEPLLNFPIIKYIVNKLEESGYGVYSHVTTNGSLITDEVIEYAIDHKFRTFQVSIDDYGERYAKAKQYIDIDDAHAYDRVIHNTIRLLQNDIRVFVRINFIASEVEKATDVFHHIRNDLKAYDNGNLYIYLSPLTLHDERENICDMSVVGEHPFLKITKLQFEEGFPLNTNRENISTKDRTLIGLNLMPSSVSCGMMLENRVVIDADGTLYKCHRLVGKKQYECGNVWTGIKETEHYKQFMDPVIRDEECKTCNILPLCQGGCKSNGLQYGHKYRCNRIKQVTKELVQYYYELLMKN